MFSNFGFVRRAPNLLKNRAVIWVGASIAAVVLGGLSMLVISSRSGDNTFASVNFSITFDKDWVADWNATYDPNRAINWLGHPCDHRNPPYGVPTSIGSVLPSFGTDKYDDGNGNMVSENQLPSSCWEVTALTNSWRKVYLHCVQPDETSPGRIGVDNNGKEYEIGHNDWKATGEGWFRNKDKLNQPDGQQDLTVHVKLNQIYPIMSSSIKGSSSNDGHVTVTDTITDTISYYFKDTWGTDAKISWWIPGLGIKFNHALYRCATPQPVGSSGTTAPSIPSGCSLVDTQTKSISCDDASGCSGVAPSGSYEISFSTGGVQGYYYIRSWMRQSEQVADEQKVLSKDFYSAFHDEKEGAIVKMKVEATSKVNKKYFSDVDQNIVDTLTVSSGGSWMNYDHDHNGDGNSTNDPIVANICVTMHGPYKNPKNIGDVIPDGESITEGIVPRNPICQEVTHGGDYNFDFGSPYDRVPGYYYFTHTVKNLTTHGAADDMMIETSENKVLEKETIVRRFQPYFSSDVNHTFIDDVDGNYNGNKQVIDTITSHAAKDLGKANDGIGDYNYWLNAGNVPVKICVRAWGPYQQPQQFGTAQVGLPSTNIPNPVNQIAMICTDGVTSGTGGTVAGGNFTDANQERQFVFNTITSTDNWAPGYYYFTEHMLKSDQTPAAQEYLIGDWHSKFNPQTEDEATIEKFQIKPTSQTISPSARTGLADLTTIRTGIIGDANHNGKWEGASEPKNNWNNSSAPYKDWNNDAIPVLKPTDAYIEDSFDIRAYDTNSGTDTIANANDAFWLKDLSGNFITFYVCATAYGPYQQPQGANIQNSNGYSSPRIPSTGIGQITDPKSDSAFPNNYYGDKVGRAQCFWTNKLQDKTSGDATLSLGANVVNGLVAKPSASGGPGTYTVRWDNQAGNYFQPGYYHIVWNVYVSNFNSSADVEHNNNNDTEVKIGDGVIINQKNGEFLESDWYSPFGEQTESFYAQFQPIAKSTIPEYTGDNNTDVAGIGCSIYYKDGKQYCYRDNGCYIQNGEQICLEQEPPTCSDTVINNCIIKSTYDPSSDNTSYRKRSAVDGGNGGIVLECDENKYSNTVNYVDNPEEYPHEKLHCHNVTDQIQLGAVSDKAINDDTHAVLSEGRYDINGRTGNFYNDDRYWPKNKDSQFEPVKFQVKLYGPFKYPYSRTPSDENRAGWAGNSLVTVVPKDVDGQSVEAAQSIYGQPIAESCVISTANVGPNWDGTPVPYDAVFTQDISSCYGGYPSNSDIELTPGFYVSIVEIVRDDIENTNEKFKLPECKLAGSSSNAKCATQITTRPHNMIIEDRFTSAWGDLRESLLVPIPLYIVTRRDNSAQDTFIDQVTINDQYWVGGFAAKYVGEDGEKHPWTDIWGDEIEPYDDANPGYSGREGYVASSVPSSGSSEYKYTYSTEGVEDYYSSDTPGDIHVRLYGAYPLEWGRPNESAEYCVPNKLVKRGTWQLPAEDTGPNGKDLPYPAPLTLYEKGWYVFQYTYSGGDRITNIKTQCGDTHEMFRIVKNEIGLVTAAYADQPTAPTRITDTVQVTGSFQESDKGSIVKLSLYKRAGLVNSPGESNADGAPICTVIFTVDAAGTYTTKDYIDDNGYILADEQGTGRCFTAEGGHYYWIEEFLRPGANPLNPKPSDYIQPPGEGQSPEDIDILPPSVPEVTTDADPTTSVNKPFRDTALVTNIPDGNTKVYKLWFTAYGPYADGTVDCNSQLIYSNQSSPITVTKNGRYESDYITVPTNGIVYWVEHLEDEEGKIVDQGECGTRRENTYVIGPDIPTTNTFEPFQVTPLYPDAGYLTRQIGKIITLGFMSMLGAWQLTNKNSWLLRSRK